MRLFGKYRVFVDLDKGVLVAGSACLNFGGLADRNDILRLAYFLDELDAASLVKKLCQAGQEPHSAGYDPVKMKRWRESIRKNLNIQLIYKRS